MRQRIAPFVAIVTVVMGYALFTGHVWEDFYITYRPSANLVHGLGLVFQPGERLHTFTSPFNVLLPAFFLFVTGSDFAALWLFRFLSALSLGLAWVLLDVSARRAGMNLTGRCCLFGFLAFECKLVSFAANGQEVGLMALGLAAFWAALDSQNRRSTLLGVSLAFLMYTRPDGFVYASTLALARLLLGNDDRLLLTKDLIRAALIGGLLYAPWLTFTTWYYGSPIPHTITAKGSLGLPAGEGSSAWDAVSEMLNRLFSQRGSITQTFQPIYVTLGGWPAALLFPGRVLGFLAAISFLRPRASATMRAASLACLLGHLYLSVVAPYVAPWYLPSIVIPGAFALAFGLSEGRFGKALVAIAMGYVLLIGAYTAVEMRFQQRVIEGQRIQIALWLKREARTPTDSVFLEPLGYIGYFSGLKMLDYPGLASNEVVSARKAARSERFEPLIALLRPDWLVLRSGLLRPSITDAYEAVQVFDSKSQVDEYERGFGLGTGYLRYDQAFVVLHRKADAESPR